jgi:hypothetical protein
MNMEGPKTYPDYASAEPALLRGEVVAIPIGASLKESTPTLTTEQEQVINLFYGDLLAKMTPEIAAKKLRGIWNANREVLKNDDLAWLALLADWIETQNKDK